MHFIMSLYESRATYDGLTKTLTLLFWVLMIFIDSLLFYLAFTFGYNYIAYLVAFLITFISIFLLVVPFLFSPRGYEITLDGVVIRRIFKSFLIPRDAISSVRRFNWSWRHLRLLGCGGAYGFFGLFSFRGIGRVWMYVTNRYNLVLIATKDNTKYLISPENPDEFVVKLNSFLNKFPSKSFNSYLMN